MEQLLAPRDAARILGVSTGRIQQLDREGRLRAIRDLLRVERTRGRVKDGEAYVVREAPLKTKHSRRTIDLSPSLVQTLLTFPASDDPKGDYLFRSPVTGGPLDPDNVDRAFARHLTLAELPWVRLHDLRHTHASLLIAAGVHPKAIQARLGHASITTTLNTYGHLMPNAFEGIGTKVDALLQKLPNLVPQREFAKTGATWAES